MYRVWRGIFKLKVGKLFGGRVELNEVEVEELDEGFGFGMVLEVVEVLSEELVVELARIVEEEFVFVLERRVVIISCQKQASLRALRLGLLKM